MKFFLRLLLLLLFPALPLTAQIPEVVDLGLSVKWASCNLGATKPEEAGDYYMWGDTIPATDRDCGWDSYSFACTTPYHELKLTKYVPESAASQYGNDGFFDNKTVLDSDDDAAHVSLGDKFRMPTDAEWQELEQNCTWTWAQFNGVNGYMVTSNVDGFTDMYIFLPAAGWRLGGFSLEDGTYGNYWSGVLRENATLYARLYYFGESSHRWLDDFRCIGFSIRPISE